MELNVQEWKEYRIDRLFTVVLSKGDIKADDMNSGSIRLVSSGETDNGIVAHIDSKGDGKAEIFNGNVITADMFCNAYYQNECFYAVSHGRVNILLPNFEINSYVGLFLSTIINNEKYKYSYGRALYSNVVSSMVVKLPTQFDKDTNRYIIDKNKTYSDEGYVPDWQFMENYIKSLHHKPITTKVKSGNFQALDVNKWEEFKVSKLFKLVHGKANDGMLEEGNDCVYLGAKLNDCGFMRKCKYNKKLAHEGNCVCFITNGEGSVGYAFYKGLEDRFIATIDLVMGYADFLTPAIGNFIATCLCLERKKYSHGRKWKKTLPTTVIKLPIQRDNNGNPIIDDNHTYSEKGYIPDWQFMEDYINSLPYSDRI